MCATDNHNINITIYQQCSSTGQVKEINNITESETHRAGLQKLEVLFLHQNAGKGYF